MLHLPNWFYFFVFFAFTIRIGYMRIRYSKRPTQNLSEAVFYVALIDFVLMTAVSNSSLVWPTLSPLVKRASLAVLVMILLLNVWLWQDILFYYRSKKSQ